MDATAPVRRASLTGAALAVAAILTAGCASSSTSPSSGAPPTTSTTSTSAATSAAPGGGATDSTTPPSPQSPGAAGSASGSSSGGGSSSAAGCTTAQLKAAIGGSQGAAGSVYTTIVFTNTSSASCTIYGYPGVSLDNSGGQIGAAATRDPSHGAVRVTLAPGAKANAIVRVTDAQNYPSGTCSPDSAGFLKIYPPNQTVALDVPYKATGCQKSSVKLLTITAVAAGTGGS